jgi:hypothetical protein
MPNTRTTSPNAFSALALDHGGRSRHYVPVICHTVFAPYCWPAGETIELPAPTADHLQQLAALDLTLEDFEAFKAFVGHPFRYVTRLRGSEDWVTAGDRRRLSNNQLIAHLRGDRWIGTAARKCPLPGKPAHHRTRYFVIDLDAGVDLDDRVYRTIEAIGRPSSVFRSSTSGGLHVWYFLSGPVDLFRLCNKQRTGGAVVELLANQGLHLEDGRVELYPSPSLRSAYGNRLRAPFGAESRLLDPDNGFVPMTGGSPLDDLRYVTLAFEEGDVPTVDFDALYAKAGALRIGPQVSRPTRRSRHLSGVRNQDVVRLLEHGLTGSGQLHDSLSRVAFHYRARRLDGANCTDAVLIWLDLHHNGHSRTHNRNPERARKKARDVVEGIYTKYGRVHRLPGGQKPGLSANEVDRIIEATALPFLIVDPETGELLRELKPYRMQTFLFLALQIHKAWVLSEGRRAFDEADRCESSNWASFSPPALRAFLRNVRPESGRTNEFIVPFPYELRRLLTGFTGTAQAPYWAAAKRTTLYERCRNANPFTGKCELYRVYLDFEAQARGETLYATLDSALAARYDHGQLLSRYGRHYARRIERQASGTIGPTVNIEPLDQRVIQLLAVGIPMRQEAA